MRVLILANGEPPSAPFAQRMAAEHDFLIATDGAAHQAVLLGLQPHLICGDFDSVRLTEAREAFPHSEFFPTPDQSRADLEKAVVVAQQRGASAITLLGVRGGRVDHALANYLLLTRYQEIPLRIVDDHSEVWAVSGTPGSPTEQTFDATPGETISLLTLVGPSQVSLSGVQWPLHNAPLESVTHGVSNVALEEQITLCVFSGTLLVCRLRSHALPSPPRASE